MKWQIPPEERRYLRDLARKQAEYAALPVMADRRQLWFDLNDGAPHPRPPVIVETWTFDRDFLPPGVFRCQSDPARGIERQLVRNIRNHELIDDDKVMPNTFDIGWFVHIDEMGVRIESESVLDAQGYATGYHFIHPVKDLKRDFAMLKPAVCRVDREGTLEWQAFLTDLLGDFLPVEICTGTFGNTMLTQNVVRLMGMEAFFLAMYDCPDELHRLMEYLRDNALRVMRWAEAEGLLRPNNGNRSSFGSSYNFTGKLPAPGFDPEHVRLRDMWGSANSQETVGVSPELFHEFCYPYYRDVCEPMGLVYFGCCEPVHPFWDDLKDLPNLKKVSISRWCDEAFMGEALQGTGIVYSRKPDPNFLGVDVTLDGEAWGAHIRTSLEAAGRIPLEIIVRDVYTVHGNLGKVAEAVRIARREIARAGRG